ncbi:DUF3465 domain-containing protein [Cellvibrio sp. OA-2007]|uniref:DUF3465 domain-containing protein n=1 Tax=Cellvibrio sp. OA-2007 TaxID=529823 RepID=UPI0009FC1A5A|nr:DUF3465 domain-containing protein [Cellvibrio sp. OA-2007]
MKPRSKMKPLLALLIFALGLGVLNSVNTQQLLESDAAQAQLQLASEGSSVAGSDVLIAEAFRDGQSNVQLGGEGRVLRILPDDNEGSRHQKFLLELDSGHTLLIAHNIDLAPRVENLREGERLEFYGEYEWNQKGGVIHWTHHDPRGQHPGGWLKYEGRIYK